MNTTSVSNVDDINEGEGFYEVILNYVVHYLRFTNTRTINNCYVILKEILIVCWGFKLLQQHTTCKVFAGTRIQKTTCYVDIYSQLSKIARFLRSRSCSIVTICSDRNLNFVLLVIVCFVKSTVVTKFVFIFWDSLCCYKCLIQGLKNVFFATSLTRYATCSSGKMRDHAWQLIIAAAWDQTTITIKI